MSLNSEEMNYVEDLHNQVEILKTEKVGLQKAYGQASMFAGGEGENLIQYQLDLKEELERVDHLLRGHVIKRDSEGNESWVEPEDDRLKPFNDYGVQLIMNIIQFYMNRNTLLSNYSEPMINIKMKDLADDINDLIYMKYEEMGMDTKEKRKLYSIIVRQLIDTIHSAYLRALHGGERESLRTARHVSQSINPMGGLMGAPQQKQGGFKWHKPGTWGK